MYVLIATEDLRAYRYGKRFEVHQRVTKGFGFEWRCVARPKNEAGVRRVVRRLESQD